MSVNSFFYVSMSMFCNSPVTPFAYDNSPNFIEKLILINKMVNLCK